MKGEKGMKKEMRKQRARERYVEREVIKRMKAKRYVWREGEKKINRCIQKEDGNSERDRK